MVRCLAPLLMCRVVKHTSVMVLARLRPFDRTRMFCSIFHWSLCQTIMAAGIFPGSEFAARARLRISIDTGR